MRLYIQLPFSDYAGSDFSEFLSDRMELLMFYF